MNRLLYTGKWDVSANFFQFSSASGQERAPSRMFLPGPEHDSLGLRGNLEMDVLPSGRDSLVPS
jgi:hypothetical protein